MAPSKERHCDLPDDESPREREADKEKAPCSGNVASFTGSAPTETVANPATPPGRTLLDSEGVTPVSNSLADSVARKRRPGEHHYRPPVWGGENPIGDDAGSSSESDALSPSTTMPATFSAGVLLNTLTFMTPVTDNASTQNLVPPSTIPARQIGGSLTGTNDRQTSERGEERPTFVSTSTQTRQIGPLNQQGHQDATPNVHGGNGEEESNVQPQQDDSPVEPIEPPWNSDPWNKRRYLELCRDIRAFPSQPGCGFGIQEGSRVICVGDTVLNNEDVTHGDTFDLVPGQLFLVLRMYSDLWASCIKIDLDNPVLPTSPKRGHWPRSAKTTWPVSYDKIKFLPLCSVTLDANYGPYVSRYKKITGTQGPASGRLVKAPRRKESLAISEASTKGGVLVPIEYFSQLQYSTMEADEHYRAVELKKVLMGDTVGPSLDPRPGWYREGLSGFRPIVSGLKDLKIKIFSKRGKKTGSSESPKSADGGEPSMPAYKERQSQDPAANSPNNVDNPAPDAGSVSSVANMQQPEQEAPSATNAPIPCDSSKQAQPTEPRPSPGNAPRPGRVSRRWTSSTLTAALGTRALNPGENCMGIQ